MELDKVAYICLESVIAVLAILSNILVVWAVKLNSAHQTTTCYFIISLALADIAVGLVVIPVAIVVDLHVLLPFEACLFLCCLLLAFTQASIMSMLAIAVDRYLRVRFITRYRTITSQKRIQVALGTVWLLSMLVGFTPIFGWAHEKPTNSSNSSDKECSFTSVIKMQYMIYLSFFVGTFIPLIIMVVLYGKVFCIIRTKLRQWSTDVGGIRMFYRKEFKTAKYLALVLFLFGVCWFPLCIMNCIHHFCSVTIPQHLWYLGILLSHSNSVMNPIVYAFKIKKFRETCFQILRTYILCKDPEHALNSTS